MIKSLYIKHAKIWIKEKKSNILRRTSIALKVRGRFNIYFKEIIAKSYNINL